MKLIKVEYNKHVDMCSETVIADNLSYSDAIDQLYKASFPAYIYEPALVDTGAYFMTEFKNKACIREYAKQSS